MCIFSAITKNLAGMLLGRLFVGIGLGLGPPVAALYVTEVCSIFVSLILKFFIFYFLSPVVDVRTCFFLT